MNRPLAVIEGNLAFPKPRPFDGLPPPFGSRRRTAPAATQTEAQQSIQDAVQRKAQPERQRAFPPGVKHVLFYKTPRQRPDAHRFDAEMAEAKRYLEMDRARPRSSRSDYVIGATIFFGCTIALAWLLATCTTREAEKATTLAMTRPAVPAVSRAPDDHPLASGTAAARLAVETTPAHSEASRTATVAARAPAAPSQKTVASVASVSPIRRDDSTPVAVHQSERTLPSHVAQDSPRNVMPPPATHALTRAAPTDRRAKAARNAAVARMTESHVDRRLASSRAIRPAIQPSVSKQPEWTVRASGETDSIDQAALLNWAAQQRARVTTHATTPVPGDTDWNARMTQRRITDNPDAFQAGRAQK
jgi:hypothetical protein